MAKIKTDRVHKWVLGVAAGLARSYKMPIWIVRLLFIGTTIFGGGIGLLVYVILWISLFAVDSESPKLLGVFSRLHYRYNLDISYFRVISVFIGLVTGIFPFLFIYGFTAIYLNRNPKALVNESKANS